MIGSPTVASEIEALLDQVEQGGNFEPEGARERCRALDDWLNNRAGELPGPEPRVPDWLGGLRFLQGHFAFAEGEVEVAIERFQQAAMHSASAGDGKCEVYALRRLALCHEYAGRQAESIDCVLGALGLAERLGDARVLHRAHTGLLAL